MTRNPDRREYPSHRTPGWGDLGISDSKSLIVWEESTGATSEVKRLKGSCLSGRVLTGSSSWGPGGSGRFVSGTEEDENSVDTKRAPVFESSPRTLSGPFLLPCPFLVSVGNV